MSAPYPQQTGLARTPEGANAKQSRRGRTSVGIGLLVMGAISTLATAFLYSQIFADLELYSEEQQSIQVVLAAVSVLVLLALFGTGIWNIVARRTWAKAPLVTAIVASGVSLIFAVINIVESLASTGKLPSFWIVIVYVAIIAQAIRLLRLDEPPMAPAPPLRPQPW